MVAKASAALDEVPCGVGHGPTFAAAMSVPLVIIRHMTDARGARRVDPVDRAHLTGLSRPSPPIHRYAPSSHLTDLVDRFWIPVWSLAEPSTQSTLQHPVCLVVVSNTYARFYGVARGRSTVTLEGDGWAVGTMLTPAAGRLVLGRSVATVTDRWVELDTVLAPDHADLVGRVRAAMTSDPMDPDAHADGDRGGRAVVGDAPAGRRAGPAGQRAGHLVARPPGRDAGVGHGTRGRADRAEPPAPGRAATRAEPQVAGPAPAAARRGRGAEGGLDRPGRHGCHARLHRPGALHPRLPDR